jgi:hypothetical protein
VEKGWVMLLCTLGEIGCECGATCRDEMTQARMCAAPVPASRLRAWLAGWLAAGMLDRLGVVCWLQSRMAWLSRPSRLWRRWATASREWQAHSAKPLDGDRLFA